MMSLRCPNSSFIAGPENTRVLQMKDDMI